MYFPLSKLHGWTKRLATRPQAIYSEVPKPGLTIRWRERDRYSFPEFGICIIRRKMRGKRRRKLKLSNKFCDETGKLPFNP